MRCASGRVLPLDAAFARAGEAARADPLGTLRGLAVDALTQLARDPRTQAVFEILFHKCELVGELAERSAAQRSDRRQCLRSVEGLFELAIAKGQLPTTPIPDSPRNMMHAYVIGLMHEWVLDPADYDLRRPRPRWSMHSSRVCARSRREDRPPVAASRSAARIRSCQRPHDRASGAGPRRGAINGPVIMTILRPNSILMSDIQTVGIIGAGTMGNGIAQACAVAGMRTRDDRRLRCGRCRKASARSAAASIGWSRRTSSPLPTAMRRLRASSTTTDYAALRDVDLVIEAATENATLKFDILRKVDGFAKPDALLATNTSSISITQLAAVTSRAGPFRRHALLQPGTDDGAGRDHPRPADGGGDGRARAARSRSASARRRSS